MKNLFNLVVGALIVLLVVAGFVVTGTHPEYLAGVEAFFAGYTAEQLIATLVVAVLFLWPDAGFTFLNWIKTLLGVEGDEANKAVLMTLTVLSVVILLVTGAFNAEELTFGNLIYYLGEAYLLSQYTYKRLTAG